MNPASEVIIVEGVSNREFLRRHALAGRVGLSTGTTLADRVIARAERHLDPAGRWGMWSHAFVCEGDRLDGHPWVIESDLQFHRKHIQLGVQENRVEKYYDEDLYTTLAVLDFRLAPEEVKSLLAEGLEMVASHTRYSLRELVGTLLALRDSSLRGQENLLARDRSFFCSAFVRHLFHKAGIDLHPGLDVKNTTPEDLARSSRPHTMWLLQRALPQSKLGLATTRVRRRVRARLRQVRRAVA